MNTFKHSALFLSLGISIIIVTGCSKDASFTKKVKGTDDYLYVPNPSSLVIPNSISLPPQNADYEIALPAKNGALGTEVDISPPQVGTTSSADQAQTALYQSELTNELYATTINASSAKDSTTLPIVLFDANFDQVWQAMSTNLTRAGFEIKEQNQTNGLIKAQFNGLSNDELSTFGLVSFNLPEDTYLLQFGDLNNKTSVQVRNEDNTYLREEQNNDLAKIFDTIVK